MIPKRGIWNDPKNRIQNQSYNQKFKPREGEQDKKWGFVHHDPGANNAVMNNFFWWRWAIRANLSCMNNGSHRG